MSNENGYRLLRNLMVGVLCGLILNIPLSIWWAASTNAKVDNNTRAIEKLEVKVDKLIDTVTKDMNDKYREKEAKEDFQRRDSAISKLDERLDRLEAMVARSNK